MNSISSAGCGSAADPGRLLDVQKLIDEGPLSFYQISVLVLCLAVLVLDGFDIVMISYVGPAMGRAYSLTAAQVGQVFASGLLGLAVGGLFCGTAADRFGRKPVLVCTILTFGLFTLVTPLAHDWNTIVAARFVVGIGLGGAVPTATTLIGEIVPHRHRSFIITLLHCGVPVGGAMAGALAAKLLPSHGWQSMFVVSGALPLVPAIAVARWAPESVRYLLLKNAGQARVKAMMAAIAGDRNFDDAQFVINDETLYHRRAPIRSLFLDGLARSTLLLWLGTSCTFLSNYFLQSWLPTLLHQANIPVQQISALMAFYLIGAVVGALLMGKLMDRYDRHICMAVYAVMCGFGFLAIGPVAIGGNLILAATLIAATGAALGGGLSGANVVAVFLYPTSARGTGIGWAIGCARFASMGGVLAGGWLISSHVAAPLLLQLAGIPMFAAGSAYIAMRGVVRRADAVRIQADC